MSLSSSISQILSSTFVFDSPSHPLPHSTVFQSPPSPSSVSLLHSLPHSTVSQSLPSPLSVSLPPSPFHSSPSLSHEVVTPDSLSHEQHLPILSSVLIQPGHVVSFVLVNLLSALPALPLYSLPSYYCFESQCIGLLIVSILLEARWLMTVVLGYQLLDRLVLTRVCSYHSLQYSEPVPIGLSIHALLLTLSPLHPALPSPITTAYPIPHVHYAVVPTDVPNPASHFEVLHFLALHPHSLIEMHLVLSHTLHRRYSFSEDPRPIVLSLVPSLVASTQHSPTASESPSASYGVVQ